MSDEPNQQDRIFLAHEAVYARLADPRPMDVTAEMMAAHLSASREDEAHS